MSCDYQDVKKRWSECQDAFSDVYQDCLDDWDFLHGLDQWDPKARARREKQGMPCLVLNQLLPYANQVVNDIRQANMAIRVSPVDDGADIETAEVLQGLIRNIERTSGASMVYSTAAKNAIGSGFGWIRLSHDYVDYESFNQEIKIERVMDFTSVYLDPASTELDGRDAEFAFIRVDYSKEQFEEMYPDRDPVSFDDASTKGDMVSVVEHYYKDYNDYKIYQIRLVDGQTRVITQEQLDAIDENNEASETPIFYELLNERNTKECIIKHCVYSGEEDPLEETEFPSQYIPIVPVIGNEVYIDDRREFHSLIRQAKDAQRMYNYWKSASTHFIALQPRTPWIAPVGSFKSYSDRWANANRDNFSTLEYDIVHDKSDQRVEPPQRSAPIQGSPAMMQEAIGARDDIRLSIGMPDANMGMSGNAVSGVALRNKQIEGDNANFHFMDNLAVSITQVGRIIIDMIRNLYTEPMISRILGADGIEQNVPINQPYQERDGEKVPARQGGADGIFDMRVGKYDVVTDVGASYSSKRQEMADKLIELIRARPDLADITGDLLFEALDLPKGKEIAERIRATMSPEMLSNDPQAARLKEAAAVVQDLQNKLEMYDAALQDKQKNTEFEQNVKLKELEQESEKIKLDAQKAIVNAQKTAAEIEKMRAETKGFNIDAVSALGNAITGLAAQVQDIGEAVEIILDAQDDIVLGNEGFEVTSEPLESDESLLGDDT